MEAGEAKLGFARALHKGLKGVNAIVGQGRDIIIDHIGEVKIHI